MKDPKTLAIVSIVVLLVVFGFVSAFAKSTTTTEAPVTTDTHGGAGATILCLYFKIGCVE